MAWGWLKVLLASWVGPVYELCVVVWLMSCVVVEGTQVVWVGPSRCVVVMGRSAGGVSRPRRVASYARTGRAQSVAE